MTDTAAGNEISTELRLLEAILFAGGDLSGSMPFQDQLGASADVGAMLEELQAFIKAVAFVWLNRRGLEFRTSPELAPLMKITKQPRRKLPKAASEVFGHHCLSSTHRVPKSKVSVVETSKGTLDLLLEVGWVRPGKRRETPGRPLTWKTTPGFSSHFNLSSLNTGCPGWRRS